MKYFFIFALSLFFFSSIICTPVADGNIYDGEYEAGANFTTSVLWFVEWNQTTLWVAVQATGNGSDPWDCYFSNQPENWRVDDYSMTDGTTNNTNANDFGFKANIKISCAVDTNCTFNQWISNGWISNATMSKHITVGIYPNSTIEYSIDSKWLASPNSGSVYMQCFYHPTEQEVMSSAGYLGLPLISSTLLPVTDQMYSQVFMSPTQNSGSWSNTDSTAWSAITAPSFNYTQNDFGALIQHNVTVTGGCYTKNLLIMPNGTLVIPAGSILHIGEGSLTTTPHVVHIFGNLQTGYNGTIRLVAPAILESSHPISISILVLYADILNAPMTGNATVTITNYLSLEGSPAQLSLTGPLTYASGATLYYTNPGTPQTRGWEWPPGIESGSPNVYLSANVAVNSTTDNAALYASNVTVYISSTLSLLSNTNTSALYADQLFINGTLYTEVPVFMYSAEIPGTLRCSGLGALRYLSDNSTYGEFSIDVFDGKSHTQLSDPTSHQEITEGGYLIFTSSEGTPTWVFNGQQYPENNTFEVNASGTLLILGTDIVTGCPQEKTITVTVQSKKSNSGMPGWAIAVIVIICLLIVGGIIAAILIIRRRRNQRRKDNEEAEPTIVGMQSMQPGGAYANTGTSTSGESRNSAKGRDWEINYDEIKIGSELGRGAFGVVYKCKWRNTECVVKQLDLNQSDNRAVKEFLKEAENVKNMRPHPNVCTVFGVCTNPKNPICIVMEFVSEGSLDNLLYTNKINVTTELLLQFAKDIASGMSHLHAENILHCDLACRNVLVTLVGTRYVLKIADFGLSKIIDKSEYTRSNKTFPIRWTAPETLRSGTISRGSDVWSYGVVLWEIMEAKRPYPELSNEDVIKAVCDEGKRLGKPNNMPEEIYQLMTRCWKTNSGERPSFNEIYEELDRLENTLIEKNKDNNTEVYQTTPATNTEYTQHQNYVPAVYANKKIE